MIDLDLLNVHRAMRKRGWEFRRDLCGFWKKGILLRHGAVMAHWQSTGMLPAWAW